ncbi:hypothetical protein C8J56DRAFT_918403 [Mycena floridula]|nr:hypothetical protein C8J56DRAFT_918403 [Mycena floridula]
MSNKRRVGVPSSATTEAARRQLMQPVSCWEKTWTLPENGSIKVFKWVRTEKAQAFSDDEGEVDEPLAPLLDDAEIGEGEDEEQEENNAESAAVEPEVPEVVPESQPEGPESASKPSSPEPQLSMTLEPSLTMDNNGDDAVEGLEPTLDALDVDVEQKIELNDEGGIELDISGLGPDGLSLEASNDLSQLEGDDALMGGALMDDTGDPFAVPEPMVE